MEYPLTGMEVYSEATDLGSKVGSLVVFLLGGPGSEVRSIEGGFIGDSRGPHSCPGGVSPYL